MGWRSRSTVCCSARMPSIRARAARLCKLIAPPRRTISRLGLTRHGAKHRNLASARRRVRGRFRCRHQQITAYAQCRSASEDARAAVVEFDRHALVRERDMLFGAEPAGPRLLEELLEVVVGVVRVVVKE